MNFTFGLLLYNQEQFVIETLESIKYQIINYGNGIDVSLIVNDDCSSDHSFELVQKWVSYNQSLFSKIKLNKMKKNLGTVAGQQFIIDNCDDEYFKLLACDDLISSDNIFKHCYSLNDNQIKSFMRLELFDGRLRINETVLKTNFYQRYCMKPLKAMRKGCYFHTPSTIYKKSLYLISKCKELNSKFILFEDDPTWYQMIKENRDLSIDFCEDIIVLYRISNKSVSNSNEKDTPFSQEQKELYRLYANDSTGLERLYYISKTSKMPKLLRFDKYIDLIYEKKANCFCSKNNNYYGLVERMKTISVREQEYYNKIRKQSHDFLMSAEIELTNK